MTTNPIRDAASKIAHAFDKIGKANGTMQPKSEDNRFALIWEYFVSDRLAAMATKRKENAKAACASAGLLGDADSYRAGERLTVYQGDLMLLVAKTNQPASRIDPVALKNELTKSFSATATVAIISRATKTNKAATSYEFIINDQQQASQRDARQAEDNQEGL
jgi:hypothetical protein